MANTTPSDATLLLPAPCSAVALAGNWLAAGSGDGAVRIYQLPDTRVKKAIRQLGDEVSSVVFSVVNTSILWLAAGQRIFCFDVSSEKLVLSLSDARFTGQVITDDAEDILNEITISKTHIAFTCDSGRVGVLDLANPESIRFLRPRHESVAGPISFIPNRPREVVSGGYDCFLRHSDFLLGTYLTSFSLGSSTPPAQMTTMSPPFVHCLRISAEGTVAAGMADGRIWIGSGGAKSGVASQQKKKSKKWEGLDPSHAHFITAATGPIVSMAFRNAKQLFVVSLGGRVRLLDVEAPSQGQEGPENPLEITAAWTATTATVAKVNSCDFAEGRLVVGGVTSDGKGAIELWQSLPSIVTQNPQALGTGAEEGTTTATATD